MKSLYGHVEYAKYITCAYLLLHIMCVHGQLYYTIHKCKRNHKIAIVHYCLGNTDANFKDYPQAPRSPTVECLLTVLPPIMVRIWKKNGPLKRRTIILHCDPTKYLLFGLRQKIMTVLRSNP